MKFRVWYFVALLLFVYLLLQVSRCQSQDSEDDAGFEMSGSLVFSTLSRYRIWDENADTNRTTAEFDFGRKLLGVNTVEPCAVVMLCIFPNNSAQSFVAGQESMLLVDMKNNGKSTLVMIAIFGKIHLPNDHGIVVQQLMAQAFVNQRVGPSATGTFPYSFVISKYLEAGKYDLVGTVLFIMDDTPCNATFFNGTIEIVESRVMIYTRTIIFIVLGFLFPVFLWWACTKLYQIWEDKKIAKRAREEAEMRWLLEENACVGVAQSSYNKKKKQSKKN